MSEHDNNTQEHAREYDIPTNKFMTNIFKGGMDQTYRMPFLKHISGTDEIPIRNIIMSLGFAMVLAVFCAYGIMSNTVRAGYMWHFWLLVIISGLTLIVAFIVPSRNTSMLFVAIQYISFVINERVRRLSKRMGRIHSAGISDFSNGVLFFDDGRVGVAFKVVGHLGNSTLPEIAEEAKRARLNYLVTKERTTEDFLITSITESDVSTNINEFLKIRRDNDDDTIQGAYRQFMADTHYKYTVNSMANNDYTVTQTLILIEEDVKKLERAIHILTQAINQYNLYAYCEEITSPTELSEVIAPLLMTSKRGVTTDVKNIQKRYEQEQRESGLID